MADSTAALQRRMYKTMIIALMSESDVSIADLILSIQIYRDANSKRK